MPLGVRPGPSSRFPLGDSPVRVVLLLVLLGVLLVARRRASQDRQGQNRSAARCGCAGCRAMLQAWRRKVLRVAGFAGFLWALRGAWPCRRGGAAGPVLLWNCCFCGVFGCLAAVFFWRKAVFEEPRPLWLAVRWRGVRCFAGLPVAPCARKCGRRDDR
ncbi:hypothetical protein DQ04_00481170 [Trypanosoma grayi]|uniref:hypothetical protein n=1 Tax=Trypanosoma grayi TaxID=71804 RepID=UPI0004F4033B|nr:hypothetical protein DQ04_00481170 [Trypanosoma grayi]KEG14422.1 hypothetical protein DQ04_00481170 [Trypanosoma grayi]